MAFFNEFPFTRTYDSDLGWLIRRIQEVAQIVDEYVSLNSIQFADPINWNITSQYPRLTIVLDNQGNAYISRQPVPAGVPLSNEDYWTEIYSTVKVLESIRGNIAHDNGDLDTASELIADGNLFWYAGNLYIAVGDIAAGNRFVEGTNCRPLTVDEKINLVAQAIDDAIAQEAQAREDADNVLGDQITAETQARESADTSLENQINAETQARESAVDAINTRIDNLKGSIYYNVKDYGAKGDGVTDDTQAFKDTIAAAKTTRGVVFIPDTSEFYLISDVLALGRNSYIMGEKEAEIHFTGSNLFSVSGYYGSIENLVISGNTTNSAIFFDLDTAIVYIWRFRHLHIMNCVHGFYDDVTGSAYIVDCIFDDVNCDYTYGTQFLSNRSRGFITMRNFKVDNTENLRDITWHSIEIRDVIGLEMEEVDVVGPVTRGSYQVTQFQNVWGIRIFGEASGTASIWLSRVLVDTTPINGIIVANINYINGNYIETFTVAGTGMLFENCNDINLTNILARGGQGLTYAAAQSNALSFNTCVRLNVSNVLLEAFTGNGLVLYDTLYALISNLQINNNHAGYIEAGNSNYNIISGGNIKGNTLGNVVQVGAQSCLMGVVINDATHINQLGPYTL